MFKFNCIILHNFFFLQGTTEASGGGITYDAEMKNIKQKCRPSRDPSKETEAPLRQTEPARVKIFEGG